MKRASARSSPPGVADARPVQVGILLALLLAATGFYAVFILRSAFSAHGRLYFTLIDDAMISMRYAAHLAHGYGLVWNVGEAPVQGFTNPLWTLLMAVPHTLHVPTPRISLVVMLASALCLLGLTLTVYRISINLVPKAKHAPLMATAITAFYFPLVFWSLRGMEVGFLCLLMAVALLAALRIRRWERCLTPGRSWAVARSRHRYSTGRRGAGRDHPALRDHTDQSQSAETAHTGGPRRGGARRHPAVAEVIFRRMPCPIPTTRRFTGQPPGNGSGMVCWLSRSMQPVTH